jgi:serine/threonine protein kinase
MSEVRNNWEGRSINGVFPLRRFLGSSNHSSVFLTESAVEGFLNAAIKIVPAEADQGSVQLWQWKTAATFSHPHLIRLLDSGQCELDGRPYLFVVMEYAEESLSQILPYRALGPDEVRELLVPTLDALASLHRENWIQGQLKPSNFLVVNDQLKLATDTIRPVAVSRLRPPRTSIYEPPESDEGHVSAASDIWALGVTLTEALTQYPPMWLDGRGKDPSFPPNLPPEFTDTVQRCLNRNAADRPTIAELQTQTRPSGSSIRCASSSATRISLTRDGAASATRRPPTIL